MKNHSKYSETWLSETSRHLQICFTYRGIPFTQCLSYPGINKYLTDLQRVQLMQVRIQAISVKVVRLLNKIKYYQYHCFYKYYEYQAFAQYPVPFLLFYLLKQPDNLDGIPEKQILKRGISNQRFYTFYNYRESNGFIANRYYYQRYCVDVEKKDCYL